MPELRVLIGLPASGKSTYALDFGKLYPRPRTMAANQLGRGARSARHDREVQS